MDILNFIPGTYFDSYRPPTCLLKEPLNQLIKAELHRQTISNQIYGDGAEKLTAHRLSRLQNIIDFIVDDNQINKDEQSHILLENLGEIIYGNWDIDDDDPLDTNHPITNRLRIIDHCYYNLVS